MDEVDEIHKICVCAHTEQDKVVQGEDVPLAASRDVGDRHEELLQSLNGGVHLVNQSVEALHLGQDGRLTWFLGCCGEGQGGKEGVSRQIVSLERKGVAKYR